jgi:3-methyladenine DNA glycosylase Tag
MARPDITELGESLLSGKIERVRKQEKRAEKDQRKALLMGLGLQLGAGAVNSFFKDKYTNFLKDERIMQSRAKLNTVKSSAEEWKSINDRIISTDKTVDDYFIEQDLKALKEKHSWDEQKFGNKASQAKILKEWSDAARLSGLEKAAAFKKAGTELKDVMSVESFDQLAVIMNDRPANLGSAIFNKLKSLGGRAPKMSEEEVLNSLYKKGYLEAEEFSVAMSQFKKTGSLAAAAEATNLLPERDEIYSVEQKVVGDRVVTTTKYYDAETNRDKEDVTTTPITDTEALKADAKMVVENLIRETVKNTFNDTGRKAWAAWIKDNNIAEKTPQELSEALYEVMQNDDNIDTKRVSDTNLLNSIFANVVAAQAPVWKMDPDLRASEIEIIMAAFQKRNFQALSMLQSLSSTDDQPILGGGTPAGGSRTNSAIKSLKQIN